MTKLKSKKMTKSTFAVIVLAILMVAMLAFGGTYAYFTSVSGTAKSTAVQTGVIKLDKNTVSLTGSNVVSGEKILKANQEGTNAIKVAAKSGNTAGYWIFAEITADMYQTGTTTAVTGAKAVAKADIDAEGEYHIELSLDTGDGKWTQVRAAAEGVTAVYAYHVTKDKAAATTSIDFCKEITFYGWTEFNADTNAGGTLMGVDIVVSLSAKAVQDVLETSGEPVTDATTAFTNLYGANAQA